MKKLFLLVFLLFFVACAEEEREPIDIAAIFPQGYFDILTVPEYETESEPAEEPYEVMEEPSVNLHDFRPRSVLTGRIIDFYYIDRRPIAVVINNSSDSWPQNGLLDADIIYEVLAEGNTTRLLMVFHSSIPEKIGPLRSTRTYFTDFALNHDAIFVHHGGSPSGYDRLRYLNIDALDGMTLGRPIFWRDRTFPDWMNTDAQRLHEHSSYAAGSAIWGHVEERGIRDKIGDDINFGFRFGEIDIRTSQGIAENFRVPFSNAYRRYFIFNPETGLYYVKNARGHTLDGLHGEYTTVSTILIQRTRIWETDEGMGRRAVDTVNTGYGYMIRDGRYWPVRWVKTSLTAPMRWYFRDFDGPIIIAPGQVWICVIGRTVELEFNTGENE